MRTKSGYALKRERGLVPHTYNTASPAYQSGAWRWWPRNANDADRAAMGRREMPLRIVHRFAGGL